MEVLGTLVNAVVVILVGFVLTRALRGQRDELRGEIATLRDDLRSEIATLRDELRSEIATLREELRHETGGLRRDVGEMRSDLTRVALAVGLRPRASEGG